MSREIALQKSTLPQHNNIPMFWKHLQYTHLYCAISAGGFGLRHMQVLLMFSGLVLAYALRVNISIGIVAMVDNSSNTDFQVRV